MKITFRIFSLLLVMLLLCSNTFAASDPATVTVTSKASILMEASTGKVLFEKNSHEKLPPASVTKVMTMLMIMEAIESGKIKMEDKVTCSEYAAGMGGSQVYLEPGEQMTVHDMLKAIAVASGNDASVAMAEHLAGSEQAFVQAMNEKAKQLGMNDTNFVNCNGLDVEGHYTSANDIALMSRELLKYPKIHEYLTIWMDSLRNGGFGLANTNKLIRFYKGANGIKTGSTGKALYCLSASAKRDNMQLIAVIMAAPTTKDRFGDASKLLDYGFANYAVSSGVKAGEILGEVKVSKGMLETVKVKAAADFNVLLEKGKQSEVQKNINLTEKIAAPVDNGQKVGEVVYTAKGQELGKVDLVTVEEVKKVSMPKIFSKLFYNWLNARK